MEPKLNIDDMKRIVDRLDGNGLAYGAGDDSQRNINNDRIDALEERVKDLQQLVIELTARLLFAEAQR